MVTSQMSSSKEILAFAEACTSKEWSKAIRFLSCLICNQPDSVPLLCNRAFCHIKLELHKHAIKDCDKALSLNPTAFQAYLYKGQALAAVGKQHDALQVWREGYWAVVNHYGNIEVLLELDMLIKKEISEVHYSNTVNSVSAVNNIAATDLDISNAPVSKSIPCSPTTTTPRLPMHVTESSIIPRKKDNQKNSELKHGSRLISLDMRLPRGISQVNSGMYEEAFATFNQVLVDNPNSAEALLGRGTALAFQGNLEAAISDFSQAIKVKPQTGEGWKRRGQARAALGAIPESIADLTKALEFEPGSSDILHERGVVYFKLKDYENAVRDLRACAALDCSNKLTQNYLGLSLVYIGQHMDGLQAHEKALELDPNWKEGWIHLAQSCNELGMPERAIGCLQKVLSIDQRCVSAYHLLGLLLHRIGDHRGAVKELSTALEHDPSSVECKYLRASCQHACGDYADAVKDYEGVLDAEVDTNEKCTLQNLAYYQREIALYTASKVRSTFACFNIDRDLDPVWKEAWCKRLRPTVAIALLSSQPHVKESLRSGRLRPHDMLMSKQKKLILDVADQLGSKIQYSCAGFVKNKRQHRMAGLAALEIAQKVSITWRAMREPLLSSDDGSGAKTGKRVRRRDNATAITQNRGGAGSSCSSGVCDHEKPSSSLTLTWQDVYSIAVKWRQASEPCDPVVWVNGLSEKEFNAGFGSHTPLMLGCAKVVRYYPYSPRAFSVMKRLILENKCVYNADNQLIDLASPWQVQAIEAAKDCLELYNVVGEDFWVVTQCHSMAYEGKILDGTRLTVQKIKGPGLDFSIRTPGTPPRWADYDTEMSYAWEALCDSYRWESYGSPDIPLLEDVRDCILRLSFYWYNFMPLARGTAVVGYTTLLGLFLAAGMEIIASIPEGLQVDWEAILSPELNTFVQAVRPWMYPSVKADTSWQSLPDVASTFQSTGSVIGALSIYDD